MFVNRGVIKYMALPNNGIIAAIKKRKRMMTFYVLIQEDILFMDKSMVQKNLSVQRVRGRLG